MTPDCPVITIKLLPKRHCYLWRCVWPHLKSTSPLRFLSPVLTSDIHLVAHTLMQLGIGKGQIRPSILAQASFHQRPAVREWPSILLQPAYCIGKAGLLLVERGSLLLVNLSGSCCCWVELEATNDGCKSIFFSGRESMPLLHRNLQVIIILQCTLNTHSFWIASSNSTPGMVSCSAP